jgi:Flp pilus assembly protein protease CpaA
MTIAYWILAALLGVFYLYAGGLKVARSQEQLAPMMGWVDTVPMWLVRLIGAVELLGVAGLILPRLTGVVPGLAVAAAGGFVVLQILAARVHLSRGETKEVGLNLALIAVAGVTVWLATAW